MQLPFDPSAVIPRILEGDPAAIGTRLATFVLTVLQTPEGYARLTGLVRAAASEDAAAEVVRERVTREILAPLAAGLGSDRPELRGSLAASQVVGMVMARHVVKVEPLASLPRAAGGRGDRPDPAALPDRAAAVLGAGARPRRRGHQPGSTDHRRAHRAQQHRRAAGEREVEPGGGPGRGRRRDCPSGYAVSTTIS